MAILWRNLKRFVKLDFAQYKRSLFEQSGQKIDIRNSFSQAIISSKGRYVCKRRDIWLGMRIR